MKRTIAAFVFGVLVCAAVISAVTGALTSKADVSFLALVGLAALCYIGGMLLYSRFDKTNGNDSGLIAFFILTMIYVPTVIIAPLLVLFLGHALLISGIAAGVIVVSGVVLVSSLIF
ncbi:hypothetical protein AMJ57_02485 [Parcubacteria bacterium SG8_24]|nr:MAG: hypothetical protein AMJ57_02485 [Parcubacteria bacterium SG8_24]